MSFENRGGREFLDSLVENASSAANQTTLAFCEDFVGGCGKPRFVLGRNDYASSIARAMCVDGFIDEFTDEKTFMGRPVVPIDDLPPDALVVSAVVLGRPLTARRRLCERGIRNLDYFAFRIGSGLNLIPVSFMDEFPSEFTTHKEKYADTYGRLADDTSRSQFQRLINFRLSSDLTYMSDFSDLQSRQYFEPFLELEESGESFLDVGGYDGTTSLLFMEECPGYETVHIFEPVPSNMPALRRNLASLANVFVHAYGLSDDPGELRFTEAGSSSRVSEAGEAVVAVDRLDNLYDGPCTYLKMDIEGSEIPAIRGARATIREHHPRLAISAYHKCDDLWRIPEAVLSIRDDYDMFLRHYTEGVTETVLFFVPRDASS